MRITSVTCWLLPVYLRWFCMGYTALLFCPDEKTARTVTQVLSELEFSVEACTEPFAAVKKLMGQHFDAVVVDCDNEQNATLLFKSARNSASNQASLAVAVVEGQAGVAKAFRIGANLVLTKPINIEQSKGTLRVARGLLRKSEPAKGAAPAAAPTGSAAVPAKPALSKSVSESKSGTPAVSLLAAEAASVLVPKPTPAWPAAAISKPAAQDDDLLGIESEQPAKVPAASDSQSTPGGSIAAPASISNSSKVTGGGAASAPAPAREIATPISPQKAPEVAVPIPDTTAGASPAAPSSVVGSAPSFTFGGAKAEAESSGGSKKIIFGVAAALIVAAGLYAGWAHFQSSADQPAHPDTVSSSTVATSLPQPAASSPKSQPKAGATTSSQSSAPAPDKIQSIIDETAEAGNKGSASGSSKSLPSDEETATTTKPEPAPLIVKGGKVPARTKATPEAAAPSLIGMAAPGQTAALPTIVPSAATGIRPTLQSFNVSQGVSTGLLIKKVPPVYPPSALRMRIEGTVELVATISKTGDITHVKIVSGDGQLTRAASDAVKQWKYQPYLLNGEPVEIQTQVTVKFKLPK